MAGTRTQGVSMIEGELKQKAKLFIISHKQNKFMFDISLVDLLTLFATKITKELEQELEHKRIAINTRKARIKDLEKQVADLEWQLQEVAKDNDSYQKENAELKEINEGYNRNRDKLIAMGFPTFKSCKEYSGKLTNLQKENATLKKQLEALSGDIPWKDIKDKSEVIGQLTRATEIISEFIEWANWQGSKCPSFKSILDKAEQFIKE